MAQSFSFYIHINSVKTICRAEVFDDVYKIYFNDEYVTDLRYDHHGKWYQSGGKELSYETVLAIGDVIDSAMQNSAE